MSQCTTLPADYIPISGDRFVKPGSIYIDPLSRIGSVVPKSICDVISIEGDCVAFIVNKEYRRIHSLPEFLKLADNTLRNGAILERNNK